MKALCKLLTYHAAYAVVIFATKLSSLEKPIFAVLSLKLKRNEQLSEKC